MVDEGEIQAPGKRTMTRVQLQRKKKRKRRKRRRGGSSRN